MTATEWAAWAQAIMSAAAIFAGFWLFSHQQKHLTRMRSRSFWGVLVMSNSFCAGLLSLLSEIETNGQAHALFEQYSGRIRTIRKMFDRVDVSELGDQQIWMTLAAFFSEFDALEAELASQLNYYSNHAPHAAIPGEKKAIVVHKLQQLQVSSDVLSSRMFRATGLK